MSRDPFQKLDIADMYSSAWPHPSSQIFVCPVPDNWASEASALSCLASFPVPFFSAQEGAGEKMGLVSTACACANQPWPGSENVAVLCLWRRLFTFFWPMTVFCLHFLTTMPWIITSRPSTFDPTTRTVEFYGDVSLALGLASYPVPFRGEKEKGLVSTVCACARFPWNSKEQYSSVIVSVF